VKLVDTLGAYTSRVKSSISYRFATFIIVKLAEVACGVLTIIRRSLVLRIRVSPPTLLIDNQLDTACYLVMDIRVLRWAVAQPVERLIIVIV